MNTIEPEIQVEWRASGPNATACEFDGITLKIITGNRETAANIMKNLQEIRKNIREQVAQEIEALQIRVADNLNVDPSMLAREAIRMAQYMSAATARGKDA